MEGPAEPSENMMKSLPYYKLLILSAIVGMIAALVVATFFWIMDHGQELFWVELPKALGQGDYESSPISDRFSMPGRRSVGRSYNPFLEG